jgi:hypothetical protein
MTNPEKLTQDFVFDYMQKIHRFNQKSTAIDIFISYLKSCNTNRLIDFLIENNAQDMPSIEARESITLMFSSKKIPSQAKKNLTLLLKVAITPTDKFSGERLFCLSKLKSPRLLQVFPDLYTKIKQSQLILNKIICKYLLTQMTDKKTTSSAQQGLLTDDQTKM